jgi:hypothetical protein
VATPPNPARQNAMQFFVFDGFKRVLSVIKCQEIMPDPSDAKICGFINLWNALHLYSEQHGTQSISGLKAVIPRRFHHIACGASLSRRHQDTEKTSRPERRRPRRHQQLTPLTASTPLNQIRQSAEPIRALAGCKNVLNAIKYQ